MPTAEMRVVRDDIERRVDTLARRIGNRYRLTSQTRKRTNTRAPMRRTNP